MQGGAQAAGTVTLNAPALGSGTWVSLSSSNPAVARVQTPVVVPAGQTSTTFVVNTSLVTADTSVTITATAGSTVRTATVVVNPPR